MRLPSRVLAAATVAVVVAACSSNASQAPASGQTSGPSAGVAGSTGGGASGGSVPSFKHVYLIVLENEDYSTLVGGNLPFIGTLASKYALAANYQAVAHPSQPNYVALFSGSTQGVTSDGRYELAGQNLVDQLEAHGKTWRVFAQGYPGGCYTKSTGPSVTDGPGQPGAYARKHNPAISFTDISTNPSRCDRITGFAQFDPAAADFEMIVPNLCNDMHDCGPAAGDAFLKAFLPSIVNSPAFQDSVLFVTTDEGKSDSGSDGGHVATFVVSPLVKPGFRSQAPYTHYSLLRTIEDAWGLGCLQQSCDATPMADFFAK